MKPESKKNLPGGFFIILLAGILLIFSIQSLGHNKASSVAFSYQIEHLVNLDLVQKEECHKIALNDNLVTFSGKFVDHETQGGKARFKYLEFLNRHHELEAEKQGLETELSELQLQVKEASQRFLKLSGIPVSKDGYRVVDPLYSTSQRDNAITVQQTALEENDAKSLFALETRLDYASGDSSFDRDLLSLIKSFQSPALGIGSEPIKKQLRAIEDQVVEVQKNGTGSKNAVYSQALFELRQIVSDLNDEKQNVRLLPLRSVRNYKTTVERYHRVVDELEKNVVQLEKARQPVSSAIWFFNNEEVSTKALEKQDPEVFNHWFGRAKQEWESFPFNKGAAFKAPDQPLNTVLEKTFKSEEPAPNYAGYVLPILPVVIGLLLLYFVFARQMKGVGSSALNFGKAPARLLTKDRNKVTFKEVAGCDEAKEELQEIVDFLKDPTKFTALGARIPKGVLLIGAPGTGKTLIAKAVAGEADRPFFSISGSDFVEMFVGVGASRIRDLFDQAKKYAPCIIFMDEIDAVGRHRGAGIGGGHDEREQTLNQLLVEMDGFDSGEGVILIAATNRPDVLDRALLRPGRFDRRIILDLPDVKGRYEILKVHARRIKLDASVELMNVARNTPGASGADLENILNESALLAARRGRSAVTAQDCDESTDKVRYGKERKSLEIDQNEKRFTAIHESGHAIVALSVKHADPVDKVTIIPRGMSLGATHFMPKKNRLSYWRQEVLDQLAVLMGGRVAEEIFIGDISSGAQMDFTQATKLVRSMVCEWGMTESLGTVAYDERNEAGQYLGMPGYHEKNYSEATAELIDEEVRKILEVAYKQANIILEQNREKVLLMTEMLVEFETLDREDVAEIMSNQWDIEKKRKRQKLAEDLHKKLPPPTPIPKEKGFPITDNPAPQQA